MNGGDRPAAIMWGKTQFGPGLLLSGRIHDSWKYCIWLRKGWMGMTLTNRFLPIPELQSTATNDPCQTFRKQMELSTETGPSDAIDFLFRCFCDTDMGTWVSQYWKRCNLLDSYVNISNILNSTTWQRRAWSRQFCDQVCIGMGWYSQRKLAVLQINYKGKRARFSVQNKALSQRFGGVRIKYTRPPLERLQRQSALWWTVQIADRQINVAIRIP